MTMFLSNESDSARRIKDSLSSISTTSHSAKAKPPSLEMLVLNKTPSTSEYSQRNFLEYLHSIHCAENLLFILDVNHFLANPNIAVWQHIYDRYFASDSTDEINIPHSLKKLVVRSTAPPTNIVMQARKFIYDDILVNLYYEFIRFVKSQRAVAHSWSYPVSGNLYLPEILESSSDEEPAYFSRKHSASSTGSRGSSIGSIMDSFKSNVDYGRFKKKLKRRFSNDN